MTLGPLLSQARDLSAAVSSRPAPGIRGIPGKPAGLLHPAYKTGRPLILSRHPARWTLSNFSIVPGQSRAGCRE